ncbi:MAG: RidA family protein [Acidobacteria bacterium]|nr:RidA family protein [Acidobacteriota bacterium]
MEFINNNNFDGEPAFSEFIISKGFVFVSGQVAVHPETGEPHGDDIKTQTETTLINLKRVLEAAGTDINHVVKCSVFLRNINDFPGMNEVYKRFFTKRKPTRTTIQAILLDPFNVEIDAIAELPG